MPSLGLEVFLIVVATVVNLAAVAVGVVVALGRGAVALALVVVLISNGAALVVQVVKASRTHAREAAILKRKGQLVEVLGKAIQAASGIEYRLESFMTGQAVTPPTDFEGFKAEIETWRSEIGPQLTDLLPGTQAAEVFYAARGDFPGAYVDVVVGAGAGASVRLSMTPGFYQYTHVREGRRTLTAILASLDSFVRLSAEVRGL